MNLQTHNLCYFLVTIVFGDHSSQNMFDYQPTFSTLQTKKKGTDYNLSWRSKRLYSSSLSHNKLLFA